MNFVYFGSNLFSVMILEELMQRGFKPALVITVPDAPVGRKKIMTPPALKLMTQKLGIPFVQPLSLKKDPNIGSLISSYKPEFGIVAAYRKFFDKKTMDLFPRGILIIHPSLLPRWRGPSPIESAILHGDEKTGITIITLDEEMDHGPIIAQQELTIAPDEYFEQLYQRLAKLGGKMLYGILSDWRAGTVTHKPQKHENVTFSKILFLQDGKIEPTTTIRDAYNRIRALSFEPGCWLDLTLLSGRTIILKIYKARPMPGVRLAPGSPALGLAETHKKLVLFCRDGALELETVQPESGKVMSGSAFLNGYRSKVRISALP